MRAPVRLARFVCMVVGHRFGYRCAGAHALAPFAGRLSASAWLAATALECRRCGLTGTGRA